MAGANSPTLLVSPATGFKNTAFSLLFWVLGFSIAMWVVATK